ncbi:hypothetical protein L6452_21040 [Arctium lappa]|uniref:Uncharacterized protein n=1 Tax=Arctium lappa TaxID=4217 RepID=A0ACB9BHH2_ARCLA|nr:hypothetical protein L6452_21040 [Arctium lappa]
MNKASGSQSSPATTNIQPENPQSPINDVQGYGDNIHKYKATDHFNVMVSAFKNVLIGWIWNVVFSVDVLIRQQKEGGGSSADIISFNPKPDDFDGVIKVLLQTYLDTKVLDLSGFVDLILQQVTVGTIIKIDEDDSVYDFVTTLNLKRCKDRK